MRKVHFGGIAVLTLALTVAQVAAAADTTGSDVQSLAAAESHVVTLLHSYKDTPAWKSQYKAAVAAQNNDISRVNADLFPPPKSAALTWTTTGTLQTPPFSVRGTFTLSWTVKPGAGVGCGEVMTLVSVYKAGSNVNSSAAVAGPYEQEGCKAYSTQVSGVSGRDFLSIDTANASVVVRIAGPVSA